MADTFDLIVIGAGPGGYTAALHAARRYGMRTAVIDRGKQPGGTCLNIGCIPSKALLESTEELRYAREHFADHGIRCDGLAFDLSKMMTRKEEIVDFLAGLVARSFKEAKVTHLIGAAKVIAPGKVAVAAENAESRELQGKALLLATGSEPVALPALPFDGERIVSSTEALAFAEVPKRLLVVGGGYIGLELGSVWARLGSEVTVVEMLPHILPASDRDSARRLQRSLASQGLQFHLGTRVTKAEIGDDGVHVTAEKDGEPQSFVADKVLVAVGRRPRVADLGLDAVGIRLDESSGRIPVDDRYQTTAEGIFAVGDLVPGPMLAHKASTEAVAFVDRLAGKPAEVNYDAIPSVVYTSPELASVGKTEEELKDAGVPYKSAKVPLRGSGRALCLGETEGQFKVLAHAETNELLGVHIVGPHASELIAEAVVAMECVATAEDLCRICHAHPTLSESFAETACLVWHKPSR